MKPQNWFIFLFLSGFLLGFHSQLIIATPIGPTPAFGNYWYNGKAELTSYILNQARYGEIHKGHAVLIFVTEDFSLKKHVKLDDYESAGEDRVKVLKLNLTKKFNTGIYPYSMMTSVFSPILRKQHPHTLKITMSSQEWCGNTFVQMNLKEKGYQLLHRSYFESEGDQMILLKSSFTEDEIWTTIRLNPKDLPTGSLKIIPGTIYQRVSHMSWGIEQAEATLNKVSSGAEILTYTLYYPNLGRRISIHFKEVFPHEIEGWEETYTSGRGVHAKQLTTRAVRNKRKLIDYWNKNRVADRILYQELVLE